MKTAAIAVFLVWATIYGLTAVKAASAGVNIASQYNQKIDKAVNAQ